MPSPDILEPSDVFERYALGLARDGVLPPEEAPADGEARRDGLMTELGRAGVRGWPGRRTLFTRSLPAGCLPCLKGQGSNLCLTTLCTRDCFFCFNPRPRAEGMSVHGKRVSSESEIPGVLERLAVRSVGLSGGEPLLDPARVLRITRRLRRRFGGALRIDLYTNGDRLTWPLLRCLRRAGLDGFRINLAARGYDLRPVALALRLFKDVDVEIPAIPGHGGRLRRLVLELDALGVPHLILHELFSSAQNADRLRSRGCRAKRGEDPALLTWSPVAGSEEAVLETMLCAARHARNLSVYYCSCRTQDWIAANALERAPRAPGSAQPRLAGGREAEEGREAHDVGHGGQQDARGQGGV